MRKIYAVLFILLLVLVVVLVPAVAGQSATNAPWTSSVTFYTPSPTAGAMVVSYYAEGSSTSVDDVAVTLDPHAAGSIFIGNTDVPEGFQGAAVLSSDVPVVATYVQFAGNGQSNEFGRLLYSGFSAEKAATTFFVPTVLNQKFGSTSTVGIQNVETSQISATVKVYALGSTTPVSTKVYNIPGQSSQVVTASELGVPTNFTGSATIEATGRVVASAQETDDAGRGAYAFEGVAEGSEVVFMPSMLCNAFGGQNSFYAIQNASLTTSANYTIEFYDTAGNLILTTPSKSLGAGSKDSINPCSAGVPNNTSGSAVIKGSSGDTLIAIGKVKAPNGMATAFVGDSAGATKVAAAYIRWAGNPSSEFRAFVAIMNVGNAQATGCTATYYDANGVGTAEALPNFNPFIKVNTNASQAGALSNGDFGTSKTSAGVGGALEVECNQPVVVVARLQKSVSLGATTLFGEDYNASAVP